MKSEAESEVSEMTKGKFVLGIVAAVAAATLAVAATSKSATGSSSQALTKCTPTADGKFKVNAKGMEELVTDKGYHSSAVVKRLKSYEVRSYIPEKKQKGQRHWQGQRGEQQAVYENRRRVRGEYGKSLLRRRGELIERSFAHCYETGGLRRCYLRGRENILKRQLIHVGAFNLSLILRKLLGAGTPRELRNRAGRVFSHFLRLLTGLTTTVSPTRLLTPSVGTRRATFFRCRRTRHRPRTFGSSATGC